MHRPRPSVTDTPDRYIAVAVLVTETQRYLMKRRDDVPWIAFPDQWSFFGGGIEPGETPEWAAISRIARGAGLAARNDRILYANPAAPPLSRAGAGRHHVLCGADRRSGDRRADADGRRRDAAVPGRGIAGDAQCHSAGSRGRADACATRYPVSGETGCSARRQHAIRRMIRCRKRSPRF